MGKGSDKLYITHSEWNSGNAYGANHGSRTLVNTSSNTPFRPLPFNYCAASLQPFKNPVCTIDGTIFDLEVISSWLKKHNTNPVNGNPLQSRDLIRLNIYRSGENGKSGEPIDPVTYKPFTDNTHIVAIRHDQYANVFAWETIDRMNIKAKMWRDLFDDTEFKRSDIVTLQDPHNLQQRDISQFKNLKKSDIVLPIYQSHSGVDMLELANDRPMGRQGDSLFKTPQSAVAQSLTNRAVGSEINQNKSNDKVFRPVAPCFSDKALGSIITNEVVSNTAVYTTGAAAASFTSTGLTPETRAERQIISEEEVLLKPKKINVKGFARIETNFGDLVVELSPEYAPKAVWNFTRLAQDGFYNGVTFHRNIPGFMLQGGDPTGDGRGGQSIWGRYFDDELSGPWTHDNRGIVSMANKGKNTNSSQFFITYAPTPHLDRKHTVFGRIVSGMDVLTKLENIPTDGLNRPLHSIVMTKIVVFVDPFAEFQKQLEIKTNTNTYDADSQRSENIKNDKFTWTGKRIRGDHEELSANGTVGKYIGTVRPGIRTRGSSDELNEEPTRKKTKPNGFGNFAQW